MKLEDVLSGEAGLGGVQRLFLGSSARRMLREALAQLLDDRSALGPCRLRRVKFKPGRKLSAYYDVRVRAADGNGWDTRPVSATWSPVGEFAESEPDGAVDALEAEAASRHLAAPFRALETSDPESGMRLLVSPLDPRFPRLVRLSDPGFLEELLSGRFAVTPVRYRPGQRHLLRYDPIAGGPRTIFAKLYEDDRHRRAIEVGIHAADWLESGARGDGAVKPLAHLPEERAFLYPRAQGAPLSQRMRDGGTDSAKSLRRAGALLGALHAIPVAIFDDSDPHELAAEVLLVARASEHVDSLSPAAAATIRDILDRVETLSARLPPEAPTFVHGDFKLDHLWLARGRLTLIDLDRCRLGEPAFDLGKLLADLQWWHEVSGRAGTDRAQKHVLESYFAGAPGRRVLRARLYEALLMTKITVRRVPLFDPAWEQRTERLLARAQTVLDRLEEACAIGRRRGRSQRPLSLAEPPA